MLMNIRKKIISTLKSSANSKNKWEKTSKYDEGDMGSLSRRTLVMNALREELLVIFREYPFHTTDEDDLERRYFASTSKPF